MARVECLVCGVKYEHPDNKFCPVFGSPDHTTYFECGDFEFDNDGEYPEDYPEEDYSSEDGDENESPEW